ncbi:nucleotidyltransferase substrate binding protein [Thiomicrorhabdus xiamenensis]|uniref:Nucleotidyltransferase substrate binding protein n=1 Tax=Thiomicrorhabdus xiamenensis TaxID=2739063 RepID=A0A7D4NP81_9GAMM|nr:nucleotidyltransferase substrate binding protein [Thiomicrorhabdus xiamenensis]QKI88291.1 nucleotidyltransferase substrate binding protein [Thiomicrorhabdus xiamenensis]
MDNKLDFTALEKAISRLDESLKVVDEFKSTDSSPLLRTLVSGVVQHFEFTYELSWKFIKRWLGENLGKSQVDGVSRQELFRLAAEYQLIDSVENWMLFHRARNETSHTYNENTADEVFKVAVQFLPEASKLLNALKAKG